MNKCKNCAELGFKINFCPMCGEKIESEDEE